MYTLYPLPIALNASPNADVVFPFPSPVIIWTNPSDSLLCSPCTMICFFILVTINPLYSLTTLAHKGFMERNVKMSNGVKNCNHNKGFGFFLAIYSRYLKRDYSF